VIWYESQWSYWWYYWIWNRILVGLIIVLGISLGRKSHFSPPGGEVWKGFRIGLRPACLVLGIASSWRRTYFQRSWLSSRTYAHGAAFSVMCSSHTQGIQSDRLLTEPLPASRDSERLDPFCSLLWRGHRTVNPHTQFSPAFAPGRYGWTLHHHIKPLCFKNILCYA
jgi:hypothetical protein